MSDEEKKKNGEYEKPESHEMEGDELEDVSGGAYCNMGPSGSSAGELWSQNPSCASGEAAYACKGGGMPHTKY
jgi:hypothetical protein